MVPQVLWSPKNVDPTTCEFALSLYYIKYKKKLSKNKNNLIYLKTSEKEVKLSVVLENGGRDRANLFVDTFHKRPPH